MKKRRQFPVGNNLFESESDNANNQINFSIPVPQPVQIPVPQPPEQIPKKDKYLDEPVEQAVYEDVIKDLQQKQVEVVPLSKAQQLIQQSQALLQRRRLGQQAHQQHIVAPQVEHIEQPQLYTMDNHQEQQQQETVQHIPYIQPILSNQSSVQQSLPLQPLPLQSLQSLQPQQPSQQCVFINYSILHGMIQYKQNDQFDISKISNNKSLLTSYPGPTLSKLNKVQQTEHQRQLRYFWGQFKTECPLLQLAVDYIDRNIFKDEKNVAIHYIESHLLNDNDGQLFIKYFDKFLQSQDWETQLFITLLRSDRINLLQQDLVVQYMRSRQYNDNQEALLVMMASIIKMESSDIKQSLYNDLIESQSPEYGYKGMIARFLWLCLKMYPALLSDCNLQFDEFYLSYFSRKLDSNVCTSEIQLLLADTIAFLEGQQSSGVVYYRIGLLYTEQQNHSQALDCVKQAIELGYTQGRDLRDRLIQVLDLAQQNKSGKGFMSYLKSIAAVKEQVKEQPLEPQQPQFYYDKEQKGWVINGVLQQSEHDYGHVPKATVAVAAPPPPQQSNTQSIPTDKTQKKNQLMRNRYVQQ